MQLQFNISATDVSSTWRSLIAVWSRIGMLFFLFFDDGFECMMVWHILMLKC